jgi:methyl-accepting chemotaxis protein
MNAEQLEEIKRHFSLVSEALRSDIRRIADGRGENENKFKEIQASTQLSFSQFGQHSHSLETDLSDLQNRIDRLEISPT